MDKVNKQELRRLAAVLNGEEWTFDVAIPDRGFCAQVWDANGNDLATLHASDLASDQAAFISTANPAAILSLLDELEQYRKDAERIEWLADRLEDTMIDGADPCEHHASGENEPWVDLWRRAIDAAMAKDGGANG